MQSPKDFKVLHMNLKIYMKEFTESKKKTFIKNIENAF